MEKSNIRIGTMVQAANNAFEYIQEIQPYGFECFSLSYQSRTYQKGSPRALAGKLMPFLEGKGVKISTLSLYGNPLADTEEGKLCREYIYEVIDCMPLFGTDVFSGFAGAVDGASIPECMARYKEVWQPIAEYAGERGVKIAFENCAMGGSWARALWNIAINPDAWELMFETLPAENIGLEWEPCHQMVQMIDPLPQIAQWGEKFFHLHGKDATIRHDLIAKHGINQSRPTVFHRTPGFGDANWKEVISELRKAGYKGTIDIEGWHDPVYRGELEMMGQVAALKYLKECRGGDFIPTPQF